MMNLKDMIKDNKRVKFEYYRDGSLWYSTQEEFLFPVPISDIGNATFKATDKAMLFMRYIRKHMDAIKKEKENV